MARNNNHPLLPVTFTVGQNWGAAWWGGYGSECSHEVPVGCDLYSTLHFSKRLSLFISGPWDPNRNSLAHPISLPRILPAPSPGPQAHASGPARRRQAPCSVRTPQGAPAPQPSQQAPPSLTLMGNQCGLWGRYTHLPTCPGSTPNPPHLRSLLEIL